MANNTEKITEHLKILTALEKLKAEEEAVLSLLDGRTQPPEEYEFHIGHAAYEYIDMYFDNDGSHPLLTALGYYFLSLVITVVWFFIKAYFGVRFSDYEILPASLMMFVRLNFILAAGIIIHEFIKHRKSLKAIREFQNSAAIAKAELDEGLLRAQYERTCGILERCYTLNIIAPEYRGATKAEALLNYFTSGKCTELTGEGGAYKLLERELYFGMVSKEPKPADMPKELSGRYIIELERINTQLETALLQFQQSE